MSQPWTSACSDRAERGSLPVAGTGGTGWPWVAASPGRRSATSAGGWPRITVVTPSFDQGRYLEETIRSVLLQGYPNLEYFVVDGGSRDASVSVIERYAGYLDGWCSEPDRGQAHAVNKGFARATGEVLGWLNSDDLLLPGALHRIGRAFRTRPETQVVAGLRQTLREDGSVSGAWVRDLPTAHRLRQYCCLAQETVYFRRAVYDRLGPIDETKTFALDYEYWLRMVAAGIEARMLPAFLGACRDHEATKRSTQSAARDRDLRAIFRAHGYALNEEDALMRGGPDWAAWMALLEAMCRTRLLRSPRATLALLRVLDRPGPRRHAVGALLRYRYRRGAEGQGRARAWLGAVAGQVMGRPQPDRRRSWGLPSSPIARARWPAAEIESDPRADDVPPDTLRLGNGWSWLEASRDHVYRWAEDGAEVVVMRPSGHRRSLRLRLESGPSMDWRPVALTVVDEGGGAVVCHESSPATWDVTLPLEAGPGLRCFRLRVPGGGRAASLEDPRILDFRATWIGWAGEPPRRDLPLDDGRTVEVVTSEAAVSPESVLFPVAAIGRRRPSKRALVLGAGWRFDDARGVFVGGHGSQLVMVGARAPVRVEIDAEWLDEPPDSDVVLVTEEGAEVGRLAAGEPFQLHTGPFSGRRVEVLSLRCMGPVEAIALRRAGWSDAGGVVDKRSAVAPDSTPTHRAADGSTVPPAYRAALPLGRRRR